MATTTHATRDRLLAQVDLVEARLKLFQQGLTLIPTADRTTFEDRSVGVATRAVELRAHMIDWPEVEIGTATAVDDLSESVDTLEADFSASREQETERYRSAVDRQLRSWRSRTDRLRLQGALATMELQDELDDIGHRLADARAGVLFELQNATDDAKDIVTDLRDDVEEVLIDVRHAIERAAKALTSNGHEA